MMKRLSLIALLMCLAVTVSAQVIRGKVFDEKGETMSAVTIGLIEVNKGYVTEEDGKFHFTHLAEGHYTVVANLVGYETVTQKVNLKAGANIKITFNMKPNAYLAEVEVFGERYKQPEKLDAITRMPLRPSEQIQSISVISEKVIQEQGALTVTDVVRNVPGVTLFGSYGGVTESMSTRGYRGIPILKNGVRIDSDFRTAGLASDMQGVESVQVIKGSAAITQGVGNDLGSPGGVINVVTKTPKFVNQGEVSMRTGSWGQFRPTFDIQAVLDKKQTFAFRLNGAFERADGFKRLTTLNSIYINPSLAWRPDDKTDVVLELDYLDRDKTPDIGTVNLADQDVDALYKDARHKYFGFTSDNVNNRTLTYAARINRKLSDKISVRAAYFGSSYKENSVKSTLKPFKNGQVSEFAKSERERRLSSDLRDDKNMTFQLDLIGRDVYTGSVKHTFQAGFDYKHNDLDQLTYNFEDANGNLVSSLLIDTIDVFNSQANINNTLPLGIKMVEGNRAKSSSSDYGMMLQEVMTINKYVKTILGVRYSYRRSTDDSKPGVTTGSAWNPMAGVMITPIKNLNLFGSFTTTTSLRSAANKTAEGKEIGASTSRQWEAGIKSDWLDNRLRFNFTYFHILNKNLSNQAYDANFNKIKNVYHEAGDLQRQGIEVELNGRILHNLQVMVGYAYLDAQYKDSPSYYEGSAPMNAPKHTANGWLQYTFDKTFLKGLSIGAGAYYVGKRPVNEHRLEPDGHGTPIGTKPFDMASYVTVNAQVSYAYKGFTARVFFNNIFDELGYSSYFRGGYINQIDARNFAGALSYKF